MKRSVLAVAVGFVTIAALSISTDLLVRAAWPGAFDARGRTDSVALLLLTIAYVGVFAIGGCYLAARLAPDRPMRHALVLGGLGLAFSVAGTAAAWATAPVWYHLVSLLLVMPYAWLGGWLRERQLGSAGALRPAVGVA
jgi:hypothetical protein